MALVVVAVFTYKDNARDFRPSNGESFSDGWVNESGKEAKLSAIYGAEHSFSKNVTAEEVYGRFLCFKSKNVNVRVSFNDEEVYNFKPEVPKLYGNAYGMSYHVVDFPEGVDGTIRIDTSPIYKDSKVYLRNIRLERSDIYMVNVIKGNMVSFVVCVILFFAGLCLTIGAAVLRGAGKRQVEMLSMGVFSQVAAGWTVTETMMLQIVTDNPSGVHFLNYMMLIFLSIPAVMFLASLTDRLNKPPVIIVIVCGAILLVVNIVVNYVASIDYHSLLTLTHIYLTGSISVCVYYIATSFTKEQFKVGEYRVLLLAFISIVTTAAIDVFRYVFMKSNSDTAMFFRFGMLMFVLSVGMYEIYELMRYTRYQSEARIMYRLAHTDSLTGIYNRTAFSEKEEELTEAAEGKGLFVLLDINNLKVVNDSYGHEEGDKHIINGARIINDSFSPFGTCYRIGGDEFFVVIEGSDDLDVFNMALSHMLNLVDDYNDNDTHPVPLQIAYGCEAYDCSKKNINYAQKEADKKMYECKKAMKN